jgi:hypothetical protein
MDDGPKKRVALHTSLLPIDQRDKQKEKKAPHDDDFSMI